MITSPESEKESANPYKSPADRSPPVVASTSRPDGRFQWIWFVGLPAAAFVVYLCLGEIFSAVVSVRYTYGAAFGLMALWSLAFGLAVGTVMAARTCTRRIYCGVAFVVVGSIFGFLPMHLAYSDFQRNGFDGSQIIVYGPILLECACVNIAGLTFLARKRTTNGRYASPRSPSAGSAD